MRRTKATLSRTLAQWQYAVNCLAGWVAARLGTVTPVIRQPLERREMIHRVAQRDLDDRCASLGLKPAEGGGELSYVTIEAELLDVGSVPLEQEACEQVRENVVWNVDGLGDPRERVRVRQDLITLNARDVRLR